MQTLLFFNQVKPKARSAFILGQLMISFMIMTILAVFAGGNLVQRINDGKARETGRYLVSVRGALVDFQIKHEAFLRGVDITRYPEGVYPTAPSFISWQPAVGEGEIAKGSIQDLIDDGHIKEGFPLFSPLGERVEWIIHRKGVCSDITGSANDCFVDAYVYTCHPITSEKPTFNSSTSCQSLPEGRVEADGSLVGEVLLHTDGYGATDVLNDNFFVGSLVGQMPRNFIPDISNDLGRVVVAAGLNTTPFSQFVRQGDTRHIFLNDRLTVEKVIESKEGILIDPTEPVESGASCSGKPEGLYATTIDKTLAVCLDGQWFGLGDYLVRDIVSNVSNGQVVAPPYCPSTMEPWQHVTLKGVNYRMEGNSNINVRGTLGGTVTGSGYLNQMGYYTIQNGGFAGTFESANTSSITNRQLVSIDNNGRVTFSGGVALGGAVATVIQGCRTL